MSKAWLSEDTNHHFKVQSEEQCLFLMLNGYSVAIDLLNEDKRLE